MVLREPFWRASQAQTVEFPHDALKPARFEEFSVLFVIVQQVGADGQQLFPLRHVHACGDDEFFAGQVEVKAAAGFLLQSLPGKPCRYVFFVWSLVRRKTGVAVDAEHAFVGGSNVLGCEVHQFPIYFFNQREHGRFQFPLVNRFACVEPLALVIPRETAQELDRFRGEVRRHTSILKPGHWGYRAGPGEAWRFATIGSRVKSPHPNKQGCRIMFQDRAAAGRVLGSRLSQLDDREGAVVLALPRGGVPVGFEVAHALNAPLDVFLVRKLGVPGNEELAMGAIASGGVRLLDEELIRTRRIPPENVEAVALKQARELDRRGRLYRQDRAALDVGGRTVVVVDDGMATGLTMRAAITALRQEGSQRIVIAVPVATREACQQAEKDADAVVCLYAPREFLAVGQWYSNFSQTSDEEVRDLLDRARRGWQLVA